jgi:hypothetical protein
MGQARILVPDRSGRLDTFYDPHAKQDQFHLDPAPNVLYGGAAGGGKSHGIRMDAYLRCLSVPGFRALLLRRTFPELRNTHIDKAILEASRLGAIYMKSENILKFGNGSTLEFGHCEDEAAIGKYLSTEYDAIYFDELVTFTLLQFKFISSRARTTKPGLLPVIRCASNPGGANSYWVKRYFILKDIIASEDPAYRPEEYSFVSATLDDNPYIDGTYEARLMALPSEALRRAYRFGDWDVFEGQYFSEWRRFKEDEHGVRPWHVIEELPTVKGRAINEVSWVEIVRAIDWGYTKPGVCGWYACLPDGRAIKFQEYFFEKTLSKYVAGEIKKMSAGMKIRYTVADPSMWISSGNNDTGESIAETFARNGVSLREADNNRINGWHRLHSWLTEVTDFPPVPLLQFYARGCPYTIRTIPSQVIDPTRPEDLLTKNTEDHAADETRYFVMSRPAPSREHLSKQRQRFSKDVEDLLKNQHRYRRLGAESVRR